MVTLTRQHHTAVLRFDAQGLPMNVINRETMASFATALEQAVADPEVKGIVLTSDRPEFVVGADLNMLLELQTAEEIYHLASGLNKLLRRLETCGKPVVCAINGNALGGGFEIALACHYRIAVNDPQLQIGLPEVQLGVLPGGGGTQRLPRLLGLQNALAYILESKRVNPERALKDGLIHDLVPTREALLEAAQRYIDDVGRHTQPWDVKGFQLPGGGPQSPQGLQIMPAAIALLRQKTYGNYPNAEYALSCVYEGTQLPIDRALDVEARYFAKALTSREAKLMIRTLFFSLNEANKGAARPAEVPKRPIGKVGILGAGMMGAGVAYVTASRGLNVVLKDVLVDVAERGKDYARGLLAKRIERKQTTQAQADDVLNRIRPTADAADLAGAELVIEAVFEDRALKASVTAEAEAAMNPMGVFASNTSTLPITGLAQASSRPTQFIGLHFFSPVDKMPLVEVILGEHTGNEALALALDYVKAIGKTPIVVRDGRGFYTSRVFATYVKEGLELLTEGVAPALIENAGRAAGMPVGPLALADEVSLSLLHHIVQQTEADLGIRIEDAAARIGRLLVEQLDRPGKKAGKGLYDYPPDEPKHLWPGLQQHFPPRPNAPGYDVCKRRLMHIQAVETLRCLHEGIVRSPQDADVGSILGWGFAPFTGGTASYVDYIGPAAFAAQCHELAQQYGERFILPQPYQQRLAAGNGLYAKA
jgi:3-hydroxyacyl-CoA dehydrogenase/enoyl-CoA hydratase/3-hydroxybutyryl-CoA epimerase